MKSPTSPICSRAKAVWGPKRLLRAVSLALVATCVASNAFAAGRHAKRAKTHRPGTPNAFVADGKMDAGVAQRSRSRNGFETADVIAMLEPGVDLPLQFKIYSHQGKLHVIHGYVLDRVPVS